MKKIVIIGLLILLIAVPGAFAQVRLDLGVDVPVSVGVTFTDLTGDTSSASFNPLEYGTFPFPEAMIAYQGSLGPVKLGGGLRGYTFIVETVAWPFVYAELDLSPIVINAGIGGGAFLAFGILNDVGTANLFIPELTVAFKLGKTFRLGAGLMGFTNDVAADANVFPYVLYLSGRFSVLFD